MAGNRGSGAGAGLDGCAPGLPRPGPAAACAAAGCCIGCKRSGAGSPGVAAAGLCGSATAVGAAAPPPRTSAAPIASARSGATAPCTAASGRSVRGLSCCASFCSIVCRLVACWRAASSPAASALCTARPATPSCLSTGIAALAAGGEGGAFAAAADVCQLCAALGAHASERVACRGSRASDGLSTRVRSETAVAPSDEKAPLSACAHSVGALGVLR
mmetsp:Transcript_12375/g.28920  ORF Transcript_12375/g.28920 Transcript_12375/m.28920 type:complete len:217 (-) Transcript_12375:777-1427(-)